MILLRNGIDRKWIYGSKNERTERRVKEDDKGKSGKG